MSRAYDAVRLATQAITGVFGQINRVSAEGLDEICGGSVVGMKHTRNIPDFLLARYLFPNARIFATRKAFWPGAGYLLRAAGFVPLTNPLTSTRQTPDYRALREFYLTLNAGGTVVYAPEAACFQDSIAERVFPGFIMKAGQLGLRAFIVGVSYRENRTIEVKAEQYDPGKKPKKVVEEEMRERLARLSGIELEKKVSASASGNY